MLLERLLPAPGDVIGGRYQIVNELGKGGFGIVYKAIQLGLKQDVAIKVLLPGVIESEHVTRRFEREVDIAKSLRHPNTIRILDYSATETGLPFYVMEFVQGVDLCDLLAAEGPFSPARARHILVQVLKSLGEAHGQGIIHRDLKPQNLLLSQLYGEGDFVKVLDFGIAKAFSGDSLVTQTQTGTVMGSPAYMAPEQALGSKTLDQRADLYAAGLILAECLMGRRVVEGDTPYAAVAVHVSPGPLPFPPLMHQSTLWPVIARATAKNPDERYPSAGAMRAALEGLGWLPEHPDLALGGTPGAPVPTPAWTPLGASPPTPQQVMWGNHQSHTLAKMPTTPGAAGGRRSGAWALVAVLLVAGLAVGGYTIATGQSGRGDASAAETEGNSVEAPADSTAGTPGQEAGLPASADGQAPPAPTASGTAEAAPTPVPTVAAPAAPPSLSTPLALQHLAALVGAITAAHERVAAAVPPLGTIHVAGDAITVVVGGVRLGETPLDLTVPRLDAEIELQLQREGYREETRRLSLLADNIEVSLRRQRGERPPVASQRDEQAPRSDEARAGGAEPETPSHETPPDGDETPPAQAPPSVFGGATVR